MIHNKVLYLDKNVTNPLGKKFLLSLGIDYKMDPQSNSVVGESMVFKIWDMFCLDIYAEQAGSITGGTIWEKDKHFLND